MKSIRLTCRHLGCLLLIGATPLTVRAEIPQVAKVPDTDPAATNAPTLAIGKGVHPRLMFTDAEIQALKAQIPTDPNLKKAYDDGVEYCKNFKVPTGAPDIVTGGDTPAIWKALGQWPILAYIYALDKDPEVKEKIIGVLDMMLNQPYWSPSTPKDKETDNSMGAACNMEMVGLLYDAVYNDLTPEQRAKYAQKMFLHARRMYWLGHKGLGLAIKYWQADPQPNHRWYRDAGLSACLLSIADEPGIDANYLLQAYKEEMDLIAKWYPGDGDCHEGAGYQAFGYVPIVSAFTMSDHVLGTNYLKDTGVKNAASQQIYYWVPGRDSHISYGDDMNTVAGAYGWSDAAFYFGPHLTRDKDMQAALVNQMTKNMKPGKQGQPFKFQWAMLAFYDPSVGQGDYKALPGAKLLSDIGSAAMHDSWDDNSVVFTFKCGPYGGYKLNQYRMENLENGKPHYINIAHDDPDAGEFALAVGSGFQFHPGVYTLQKKLTIQHNTLTVDDKGQIGEGDGFSQPVPGVDMRTLSYLTGWKQDDKGRVIIQGEAGPAYRGVTGPEMKAAGNVVPDPVLSKFRRTAVWLPGEYILILDDVAAPASHKITWHGDTPTGATVSDGHFTSTSETGNSIGFQLLSNQKYDAKFVPMVLDGRFGNFNVQQFQADVNAPAVKFACLIDPWGKHPEMKFSEANGVVTLNVHSDAGDDTWTWKEAGDLQTPAEISGQRGAAPLISLTTADKAPQG